jgi:YD repeat-containing protein
MPKSWALGAALAASIGVSFVANADDVTIPEEYAKLIQAHSRIGSLDGGFFGDHVDLATGRLDITQTDIDLPGNNGLDVRVGRRFEVGRDHNVGHFGYWDLDIPHLHGTFAKAGTSGKYWVADGPDATARCSDFGAPPLATYQDGFFSPDEFWHGVSMYLPGGGDQELLVPPSGTSGDVPDDGQTYVAITREGAAARCRASLASTSDPTNSGEGFEVVTPDGTVYRFDQLVSRDADTVKKTDPNPLLSSRGSRLIPGPGVIDREPRGTQGSGNSTNTAVNYVLPRREVILYPTLVTDRFGNTVTYTWDSSNPWRLNEISSSDGRHLYFTYSATDPDSYEIETVSDSLGAGKRTWTYTDTGTALTIAQPDGGIWQIAMRDLAIYAKPHPYGVTCDLMSTTGGENSGTITAPSGATVQYTLKETLFGRSEVGRTCRLDSDGNFVAAEEPYLFASMALKEKKITGPGLPTAGLTWSYAYGAPNNCWAGGGGGSGTGVACTSGSSHERTTTVTAPDGAVSRYTFGNQYLVDEGLLKKQEFGVSGSTALRTVAFTYASQLAMPYFAHNGNSLRNRGDYNITEFKRPQASITTTQQGESFIWEVATGCGGNPLCFDARARPTSVVRTGINTPTPTQTETTTYDDDTTHWILGQVAQRTIAGLTASSTTFDGNHLPWKVYAFGKLKSTFTYNTDGTIATVRDGNNNVTTYGGWKRGIPQSVTFADSTSRAATVDDRGFITEVTDENDFDTGYAYDAMGRITAVSYPVETSGSWNATTSVFERVTSAENGLAAGHWREKVSTGDARKVTLFDALWRPVLVREYDNGNVLATDHYVATAYDGGGRVADASYPLDGTDGAALAIDSTTATWKLGGARPDGVRTSYDGLGRPTLVRQDSETPAVLETKTEYLSDFPRRVTDARLNATTEQFMAWDSPTYDWPVRIDAPEDQTTTITRDTFGKPTSITRGETP